jgi:hypothetical protein
VMPEVDEWRANATFNARAKDGETVTTCVECFAVVSTWDVQRHQDWHKTLRGGSGSVSKLWEALKHTNARIDRLLNGVVRLK